MLVCTRVWQEVDVSRLGHILSQGDIDWDYVVVAARRQGVLPLVAQALRKHGAGQIPESKMKRFDELFRSNAVQALRLTAALAGLLKQFESEGIAAVSFKGPLLGQELYGDVTLRQFDDLDIIVTPQDLFRAITLFEHHGFHLPSQDTPLIGEGCFSHGVQSFLRECRGGSVRGSSLETFGAVFG